MGDLVQAILAAYAGAGLLFALPFAWRGAAALDPAARRAPLMFRLLIMPGTAALWPVLAARWFAAARGGRVGPPAPSRPRTGHTSGEAAR